MHINVYNGFGFNSTFVATTPTYSGFMSSCLLTSEIKGNAVPKYGILHALGKSDLLRPDAMHTDTWPKRIILYLHNNYFSSTTYGITIFQFHLN